MLLALIGYLRSLLLGGVKSNIGVQALSNSLRRVSNAFHVGADLLRDLLKNFLSQIAPSDALIELHELDDVASRCDSTRVSEATTVAIKFLHR